MTHTWRQRWWGFKWRVRVLLWPLRIDWRIRTWWAKRQFACRVCGVQCDMAPADITSWRSTAICPAHCPEHDYDYDSDLRCRACVTCGLPIDSEQLF